METFENALPVGTVLDNRYKIESVLGEGGFGVTYKAHDSELDYTVVIKEFLPQECAARAGDSVTVQARTNRTDDYEYGLTRFIEEARTLAKFQHNNIVRVSNFVKSNGTAYFVMDYAEGEDLSDWLKKHEVLNEDIILKIIAPILEGLGEVHKTGLMHRDIKPGNIFMRKKGGPMLIDFGAARQALGEHSKSISAIISMGYAPPEQYSTHGKQGSYTDLYAIGAVLYKLIIGNVPIESSVRSHAKAEDEADPLIPATEAGQGKASDWLLQLTDQLLNISAKNRPQTAEAVLLAIQNKTTADVGADSSAQPSPKRSDNKTRVVKSSDRFDKKTKKQPEQASNGAHGAPYGKIAAIMVVVAIAAGGWWFSQSDTANVGANSFAQNGENNAATQSKILAKGNAILYVDSQPSEAEIYLDGILLGQTPYKNEALPKGEHEIKLSHASAETHKEKLVLKDNIIVKKQYQLKAASGSVSLFSTPEGARITLNGKDTGLTTPATLESVATGEHQIALHKDTYYPKEITISVFKGKAIREDVTLEGGHLVKYKGEWLEPEEKEKRITEAKPADVASSTGASIDWSGVESAEVTLFYPGQASMEWMLTGSKHGGKRPFLKGDRCFDCHEGEEENIGNLIVTGDKVEPTPIPGKRGSILVNVQATHDADNLYMRFQWPEGEHAPVPFADGGKMDPNNPIKLAIMLSTDSKDDPKVEFAERAGCWQTCHHDVNHMPDQPEKSALAGSGLDTSNGFTKYLKESRTAIEINGRGGKKRGGWDKLKDAAEIQIALENGSFMDLLRYKSGTGESEDGYILAERVMTGGQGVNFTGSLTDGVWTVEMTRKLTSDKLGDVSMVTDQMYNIGFAIHDDFSNSRFHHVSLGLKLGFDNEGAEINALAQ